MNGGMSKEDAVKLEDCTRWIDMPTKGEATPESLDDGNQTVNVQAPSKFPVDHKVNAKIRFYEGPNWRVQTEAVVNSTTVHLEAIDEYHILFEDAGPGLVQECVGVGGCKTGEARITAGYALPAAKIIHTVGPRWAEKYKTAAENALCHSYRSCLELAVEHKLRSVSFGCIHLRGKGYPREEAAHVALRTVRRFLEKWGGSVDEVVFALVAPDDFQHFVNTAFLYFPRTAEEEALARDLLPSNTGNESGELILEERDIRIGEAPASRIRASSTAAAREPLLSPYSDAGLGGLDSAFVSVTKDPDDRSGDFAQGAVSDPHGFSSTAPNANEFRIHLEYANKAKQADLTDIGSCKVLFKCGVDFEQRPVMVMVGAHLDPLAKAGELDRFLLYAVKEMQPVCRTPYSIVYLHAEASSNSGLELTFIRQLHAALGPMHKDNIKTLFVVHPTWALRAMTAGMAMVGAGISRRVWRKAVYIDRLDELFTFIPPEQLFIPDHVWDYDRSLTSSIL